ncbi:hypothetical protein [Nocardioides solisilvae]|uniref:hypothetical protein n=1 Tax=Nocardioides solisilvae TaxID=1542435 RepID=UPI000D74E4F1|nr:hypothetical protein [Nocardioides solisilvae]
MRFTEHELTTALTTAAKSVLAAQRKDVRKGRTPVDEAWASMDRYARYQLLEGLGSQLLPVLVALPDVEVPPGERPTFTDAQVVATVEEQLGDEGGRLRRKVTVAARAALARRALDGLPPRGLT